MVSRRGGLVLALLWIWILGAQGHAATLFEFEATWRWRKATADPSPGVPGGWTQPGFADGDWEQGVAPLFYGEALTGTELPDMRGAYTGVYLRRTFVIDSPAALSALTARASSDDGFVAWINGQEVIRFNVPPGDLSPDSVASGTFNEPLPIETFDLPAFRDWLVPGTNVIAVQALNASLANSSDFVFALALDAEIDEAAPVVTAISPPAGSRVRELSQVTVVFNEPVSGVDAADLRINGVPATRVSAFGPDQYVFEFTAPAPGLVTLSWDAASGIVDASPRGNVFAGGSWTCTVDPTVPPPGVTLSEFMADNKDTLNDEDGDASDWIEIENASDQPVDLTGWGLTDNRATPFAWRFPFVSVPARGYLVVFASGKNRTNALGRLHTDFRLGRGAGYLGLFRPNGEVASEFAPNYPAQLEDVSYGRLPTDSRVTGFFPKPTPGARNLEGGPGFAPEVGFSRAGGTFIDPFPLTLSAPGTAAAATIRFTLDGTVPGETSPIYREPIQVTNSLRVRARAFVTGLLPGPLSAEYFVALNPSVAGVTSSLPLVVIHSFGGGNVPGSGEYPAFLAIHEPHGGVSALGQSADLRSRVRLNRRGSSTFGQPKANYGVEFRDERDEARDVAPLGMPEESDWILYAPNNFEPILIHNPMAFQISRELGRYAPRTRFVEVYVATGNGAISTPQYAGVYVLMEKIKRDRNRVDIPNLEPEHVKAPEVTGGYLLKIDRLDPGDGGFGAAGQGMGFVDPKEEEMNLPQRQAQRTYIQTYLDAFGESLYAANWRDPVLGWRAFVDVPSWIDHHLINVLTFNVDALRLSTYFYKPRNGKLEFGPVWDFDRALNSTDGRDATPTIWRSNVSDQGTDFFNYPWWGRLFEDPDFWQAWIDRYQDLRTTTFSTNRLFGMIDELTSEVRAAQPRDAARWPGFISPRGSYQREIDLLKTWLTRRLNFMDTNFLARPTLAPAVGQAAAGFQVQLSGPAGATLYYTTDGTDPRAPGGAVASQARTYTGPVSVTATTVVRARAFNASHRNLTGPDKPPISSSWSGVVEGRYAALEAPAAGDLQFTEIQYRPPAPSAAELAVFPALQRSDFEFVEIRNRSTRPVDLWPVRFSDGVDFRFATGAVSTLDPGARVVVVRNAAAFRLRAGASPVIAGQYSGGLERSGEWLRLVDGAGAVLAEARYENVWHPATDGLGFTLVPVDETSGPANPTRRQDWRPSSPRMGSPGAEDPAAVHVPEVVIEEVLTHTDPPLLDGVELRNRGDAPADVSGWWLTDDRSDPAKFRIPEGTVIPPGGYLWFDERQLSPNPLAPSAFLFNSLGDEVWLFAASPDGNLLGPADGFAFGAAPNGLSFGRDELCDGTVIHPFQVQVTPGAANAGRLGSPVVVSEVHYHPPDLQLGTVPVNDSLFEFVEITNLGREAVPLWDSEYPTNVWRVRGDAEFAFPTNTVLAPGGVLVVVNFNPATRPASAAAFRTAFNVPAEATLLGPLEGSLPNGEGRVTLARPDVPQPLTEDLPGFVPSIAVDSVPYSDRAPWPAAADGAGQSLTRVDFGGPAESPGSWVAAAPSPGRVAPREADTDADGLPDTWEARYCLNPGSAADAQLDADGDGATALEEFRMGTDPTRASDVLRWADARVTGGEAVLHFPAKPGVAYVVEAGDGTPGSAWSVVVAPPVSAVPGMVEVRDPVPGTVRLYRIRVVTP